MQASASQQPASPVLSENAPPKPERSRPREVEEPLPRAFGRLTLLKPIARGGMGEVFLATAGGIEGAERPCVVKIIRREHAEDRSFLARFFDEARIQAQFDHPGVAKVLEASIDPSGKPFVVVEYVEGRNLAEVRNRGSQLNVTIGWPEAVAIGVAMAQALGHVHERTDADGKPLDIVHRDLSPQNVMAGYGGDVKLIDFGTARGENRRCHTVSGVVLAKPGYVAPEVANNTPGGIPADLYAIGIILWELLAGRRFLTGDASAHVAAVAAGRRNPAPIAALVKAPQELDTMIARLTAPLIEDRYASAREAATDLVRLLKKAPSLADGERGVRARIAHLMERLYPAEPARSRAELARLIAGTRDRDDLRRSSAPSPSPPPAADDSLFPGTRYRVVRELGRGAMGVVYEAQHVDIGRIVALKVLPKERCDSAELEGRFRTEARTIARLRHDNLVALYDFGVSSDARPYYAMELLRGESIERYLEREGSMAWRDALRVGIDVCNALEVAHAAGLVHRDIKPGNLFRTAEGRVKLLDFGVAQSGVEADVRGSESALRLLGTVEYMAPEQATHEPVDERADIFGLGVVLYELVTGRLPHSGPNAIALIDNKMRLSVEAPSKRVPERKLPRAVDRAILKALALAAPDRFQDVRQMRAALEAALASTERGRARRRAVALGLFATSLFCVAGVGAYQARLPEARARAAAAVAPIMARVGVTLSASSSEKPAAAIAPPQEATPVAVLYESPKPVVEGAQKTSSASAPAEPTAQATPAATESLPEAARDALTAAAAQLQAGKDVPALSSYRRLATRYPEEPEVLEGWSRAAVATKGWGEALRAAIRWAAVDETPDAQLHLARVQRAVGQRYGAIETLNRIVERHPDNGEARELLALYSPKPSASLSAQ